jgi:circadian clock protein KaiC
MQHSPNIGARSRALAKAPTGIQGLDEITNGGLPRGRPTLVCGGAGSGKTLLAASFLVNGAEQFGEPGVFMTFEENGEEIASDVASLGFDLPALVDEGKLFIDYVRIERSEIEETGEYDLEGLFVRLDHAIRSTGAKRIVLDTIESLFSGLSNANILRAELRRLFRWLKDKGLTAVITAERGEGTLTRLPSGVRELDGMLGGQGYFRGSTVLVSGTAGTGKTSLAAHFADAACRRDERVLYFLFEESPHQLIRNMRSIGIDLQPWVQENLLHFQADRPSRAGLEAHLASMYQQVRDFRPSVTIVDAVTNLLSVGTQNDVRAMLMRVIDYLKVNGVTGFFTSLTPGKNESEETEAGISSLMDSWIVMTFDEVNKQRNRAIRVLKSRGMAHSNRVREYALTDHGLRISDAGG